MTTHTSELTDPIQASLRHMLTSVLTALALDPRGTPEDHAVHRHTAVAILGALHPNDPIQHMLAARAAAAHFAAMECFRLVSLPDQLVETASRLLGLAERMARMSVAAMDGLKRCQAEAADRRRPGVTFNVQEPHAPVHPATAASPSTPRRATTQQEPHAPVQPAATALAEPTPQGNVRGNNPLPSEPPPGWRFDRETWQSALASMTPEERQAFADSIHLLSQIAPGQTGTAQWAA